jgi:hypothetical protein
VGIVYVSNFHAGSFSGQTARTQWDSLLL